MVPILRDRIKLDDKIFLQDPLFTTIPDRVKISESNVFQKPKNLSIAHSILLVEPYKDLLPIGPQLVGKYALTVYALTAFGNIFTRRPT